MRLNAFDGLLALTIIISVLLNVTTLYNGHNWGGDFAQYLINALNLINHKPYNDGVMLDQIINYPPGFPSLLATLIPVTGLSFIKLKWINIIGWYLSSALIWLIYRDHLPLRTRQWVVIFFLTSSFFFLFKQNILSDIPFLAISLAAIYYLENYTKTSCLSQLLLGLLLLALSLQFRSASFALYLAGFCYCVYKPNRRLLIGLSISLLISCLIIKITALPTTGFLGTFWQQPIETCLSIIKNYPLIFQSLAWFFCHGITPVTLPLFRLIETLLIILAPVLIIILIIAFIKAWHKRQLTFTLTCLFVYFFVLICWSQFNDSPNNFTRYTFLLAALCFLLIPKSWLTYYEKPINYVVAACVLINVTNIAFLSRFNDDDLIHFKPNVELFEWMKKSLNTTDHYMIWEPRTSALMTQRVGSTLAWMKFNTPADWPRIWEQSKINYLILNRIYDESLINQVKQYAVTLVWENQVYQIFKINHPNQ